MSITHVIQVRVRYAETDAQGVAHHSSYAVWFESGRVELLRARGVSYRDFEAAGYMIVVTDLRIRYRSAARFDDLLILHTTLTDVRSRTLAFEYEIRREDGLALVAGRTDHVVLDLASRQPARLPAELIEVLGLTTDQ